ncbi:MAG: complex I NDUFA9 subunit family protein [Sphingomonadales bacterium]
MQGKVVTVFGGSGFIGRYIVRALLARGARVRVAGRDPSDGWFLKTQGGLGQTQFVAADVRKPSSVARALIGADAAINLVGILKGDFQAFHVDGARNVAEAAAKAGCTALVHLSAIGADVNSAAHYGRSKGEGEAAVRAAFPDATILRPSIVFGREDNFVNRFAGMIASLPVVPVIRAPAKLQPIYVADVANAVVAALDNAHGGKTYEIGGPQVPSMFTLNKWIAQAIGRDPTFLPFSDALAAIIASTTGWLPGAPITPDQLKMLQTDNVVTGENGLKALGITPTPIEAVANEWLVRYRRHGRFTAARA